MAKIALIEDAGDTGSSELAPHLRKTAAPRPPAAPVVKPVPEPAPAPKAEAPTCPAGRQAEGRPPPDRCSPAVALVAIAAGNYFGHEWWTTGRFMISTEDAYVGVDLGDRGAAHLRLCDEGGTRSTMPASRPATRCSISTIPTSASRSPPPRTRSPRSRRRSPASTSRSPPPRPRSTEARAAITSAEADRELAVADLDRATQLNASQFALEAHRCSRRRRRTTSRPPPSPRPRPASPPPRPMSTC